MALVTATPAMRAMPARDVPQFQKILVRVYAVPAERSALTALAFVPAAKKTVTVLASALPNAVADARVVRNALTELV